MRLLVLLFIIPCISGNAQITLARTNSIFKKSSQVPDTVFYKIPQIKAIGFYYVNESGYKIYEPTGLWTEYFSNGQVRSSGNYTVYSMYIYTSTGPFKKYYAIKTGAWQYFHQNGQLQAAGIYKIKKEEIDTGIENQFQYTSSADESWLFFDSTGKENKEEKRLTGNRVFY